jgi:quinol-cytochrome oxidoreductase complex cytochrome b subunit
MVKVLQQLLRWLFMRIENVFNVAFGDKMNPFYHLGTISFWQFWLLVGSGLYLYIFADTGVHDAFESVERITHDQWWAGGILRSIHRYATDGMILTMLLHMLRHFAYDRYRGFRSFSWLTGVALLWLVYIAGVNGFMLVWDKLAQFVVIATAEWFDVLPMFNGTLIRNFLYLESVNSRLFTLLAFIHIGAPLIVAFIMWVHVQRVPRAHINPPRPIAIAVTLMFLALALVKPILSQGGEADMSVVPTNIDFDWFELPVLALVYVINPLHLWYWVLGLTALLFLLPWLPPKRLGSARAQNLDHLPPRPPGGQRTLWRNTARRRPAPGHRSALRMPQRRLWRLQVHGAAGQGRPRPLPAERTVRRRTGAGQGAAVLRQRARRRRDRVPGEHGAKRLPGVQRPRRRHGEAHRRRHARPAQAAGRPADRLQGRPVHQHHP